MEENKPAKGSRFVRVLTPDPEALKPQTLGRPFLLMYRTSNHVVWHGVTPLPNLLEVLGMAQGGGAPGFTVEEITPSPESHIERNIFLLGFLPSTEITNGEPHFVGQHIGTSKSAGVILNFFMFTTNQELHEAPQEEVIAAFSKIGYACLPLVEYRTPPEILATVRPSTGGM